MTQTCTKCLLRNLGKLAKSYEIAMLSFWLVVGLDRKEKLIFLFWLRI